MVDYNYSGIDIVVVAAVVIGYVVNVMIIMDAVPVVLFDSCMYYDNICYV